MPKSISAVKDLLRRTEGLLEKVKKTIPILAQKESKILLREVAKGKTSAIKAYKIVIKKSEAFLAEQKKIVTERTTKRPTPKKRTVKKASPKKTATVKKATPKKVAAKKAAPKKTTAKKATPKKTAAKKRTTKKTATKK